MKICPTEAELFHADRWTDMTKLTFAFRNFANAPKNEETITSFPPRTHARTHAHLREAGVQLSLW